MAQYTERVYATDSWQENYEYGAKVSTTRGTTLTAQLAFAFTFDGIPYTQYADSGSVTAIKFPASGQYRKKKMISARKYAYVENYSSSASGSLSSGRFAFGYLDGYDDGFNARWTGTELSELTKGAYNQFGTDRGTAGAEATVMPGVNAGATGDMRKNSRYTVNASLIIHSHTGTNKPYADYVYEDVTPQVRNCAPQSGFVNEKAASTFRWEFYVNDDRVAQPPVQQAFQFRWRATGTTANNDTTVTSASPSYTVPANTFTGSSIDWCVRVQSDDGIWSDWSDWYTIFTVDSTPFAAAESPVDAYVDGSQATAFRWWHLIITGTPPTGFELQYSANAGSSWVALASASTAATGVVIPANTLPAGQLLWRVKTYNSDGVASAWSTPATIIVRAAPPAPVLTLEQAKPRPLFQWQSNGQAAWCLTVKQGGKTIYTTGETPGAEKSFQYPDYLANGSYEATLWIKNVYSLRSPAATVAFVVDTNPTERPILLAESGKNKVILTATGVGFARFYIFRDDIMVSKLTEPGQWEDLAAGTSHTYFVRGVTAGDAFADSYPVWAQAKVEYAQLSDPDDLENPLALKYRRGEDPTIERSYRNEGQSSFYAGRRLPVRDNSEHWTDDFTGSFSFRVRDRYSMDRLRAFVSRSKALLYRDYRGERCYIMVTGLDYATDHVSRDFTISATLVDYVEGIDYDPPEVSG